LTNKEYFPIGVLGKPHSLSGFQYINIENFFRNFEFNNIEVLVDNKKYIIEVLKKHLKNRNLIKFKTYDSINSISHFRNKHLEISSEYKDQLLNEDRLPWPGFFRGSNLVYKDLNLKNYSLMNQMYFCEVENLDSLLPYNSNFFTYENGELALVENSIINPGK